jgi:hypothetical protein
VTLVLARRTALGVRVLSDIRVSHPEERRDGLPYGVLKAVLLNANVCACFAGSVGLGAPAVAELAQNGDGLSAEEAVKALDAVHQRNVENSEFVVARHNPPAIWKIANKRVQDGLTSAWIGDQAAFARFQELALSPSPSFPLPPGLDPDVQRQISERQDFSKLSDAFRGVISDPALTSVGDLCVAVSPDPEGFSYLPYMEMDNGLNPPSLAVGPGEEVNLLRAGTAAIGAFAFSLLVPVDPGVGMVAVHVLQASLGYVYYPAASLEALVFKDVTAPKLIERIGETYGVVVSGILFGVPPGYEPPAFRRS